MIIRRSYVIPMLCSGFPCRKLAKFAVVLIPLFGVIYIVSAAYPHGLSVQADIIYLYCEMFYNSFQVCCYKYVCWHSQVTEKYGTIQIPYILRKTIEGYGFCFDFIVKGIIFSIQIIDRYVAEPSLCKDSIKFSRCLEALLADLQKR